MKKNLLKNFVILLWLVTICHPVFALPQGQSVEAGSASFDQPDASTLNITADNNTVINFNSFNIAANETVNFIQPSASAALLSRVIGNQSSSILGRFSANGTLFLINPNGITFGSTAQVNVGTLVASTLEISTNNFLNHNYVFERQQGSNPGQIVNQGTIAADNIALISNSVDNSGIIQAKVGSVNLASGNKTTVSFDNLGLIQVEVPTPTSEKVLKQDGTEVKDAIANSGTVEAKAVYMTVNTAQGIFENAVNQTGVVQSVSLVQEGGIIKIVAQGADIKVAAAMTVGKGGTIDVSTDKNIQVQGDYKAPSGKVSFEAKGDIALTGPTTTVGDTVFSADGNISIHADVTTDSGSLDFLADADKDGIGSFMQDAATTIKTTTFGDITIQSSGPSTLANIISAGNLILKQGGAPAVFTQQPASSVSTAGSLQITPGVTVNANQTDFTVYGSWLNDGGTFNGQNSTVEFKGINEVQISGINDFNNMKINVPGKVVDFQAGSTQNILGILQLNGGWGQPIVLRSTSPPVPWKISPHGITDIAYVDVSNSDNINILGPPITPLHSRNSLGNTGWNFSNGPVFIGNNSSNWSDPLNWDGGFVPGAFDLVRFTSDSHDSILDSNFTIAGLILQGNFTKTLTLISNLSVTGDVVFNGGTLNAGSSTMNVSGNWSVHGGNFQSGNSTVIFNDASKISNITGNNTFYNLTCLTPGKTIVFEADTLTTVEDTLTIRGGEGGEYPDYPNYITLESSIS
ncbi:MAG: filamentous hemagglutinin N-terminal domain-containing protein, partial [Candidatus Omnitrophica bacterium]|nr:filamentous hemagglutinin N-terminal domain-containing protein [Candidatus Omnitrophota bacterium]